MQPFKHKEAAAERNDPMFSNVVPQVYVTSRRPSDLVGNLHTCWCVSREFDSCQSRISILSSVAESVSTRVSKVQPLVDEL